MASGGLLCVRAGALPHPDNKLSGPPRSVCTIPLNLFYRLGLTQRRNLRFGEGWFVSWGHDDKSKPDLALALRSPQGLNGLLILSRALCRAEISAYSSSPP